MSRDLTILETDRLLLRRLRPEDVDALVALWCDSDVTRFMGGPREADKIRPDLIEDAEDPFAYTYDLWPLIDKAKGTLVGHCGLLDKTVDETEEIELTYVLEKASWGRGFATEVACALRDHAFGPMKLCRLISLIEPENAASERVALKVGMQLERDVVRPGGAVRRIYAVERKAGRTDEGA